MGSFYEDVTKSIVEHWPWVAGMSVIAWFGFPIMFKNTLLNGGGKIIRKIIKEENLIQSEEHDTRVANIVRTEFQRYRENVQIDIATAKLELKQEILEKSGGWNLPK